MSGRLPLAAASGGGPAALPTWLRLLALPLLAPVVAPALAAAGAWVSDVVWVAYVAVLLVVLPLWLASAGVVWLRASGRGS